MGFASFVGLRTGQDTAKPLNNLQAQAVDYQGRGLFNSTLATLGKAQQYEAKYKPGYVNLDTGLFNQALQGLQPAYAGANTASRTADLTDLTNLGPGAISAFRGMNPLNQQLADQAGTGLAEGSQIDPATMARITSSVQGDWANRGLGGSAPAQLDQALQLYGGGNQLLQQRQQFAQGVAQNENNSVMPLLTQQSQVPGAAGQLAAGAGPTLTNSGQAANFLSQAYGVFNQDNQQTAANSVAAHSNINNNATQAFTSSA